MPTVKKSTRPPLTLFERYRYAHMVPPKPPPAVRTRDAGRPAVRRGPDARPRAATGPVLAPRPVPLEAWIDGWKLRLISTGTLRPDGTAPAAPAPPTPRVRPRVEEPEPVPSGPRSLLGY